MKPGNPEVQQEINRRRAANVGYLLLTDEEILREIQSEKNPPVQKETPKPKAKKKKKRRRPFRAAYPFS